jgi:hypothetical protein
VIIVPQEAEELDFLAAKPSHLHITTFLHGALIFNLSIPSDDPANDRKTEAGRAVHFPAPVKYHHLYRFFILMKRNWASPPIFWR